MDAKDHGEQQKTEHDICHLEWIAWAIEAARKHKEIEHRQPLSSLRRRALERVDE